MKGKQERLIYQCFWELNKIIRGKCFARYINGSKKWQNQVWNPISSEVCFLNLLLAPFENEAPKILCPQKSSLLGPNVPRASPSKPGVELARSAVAEGVTIDRCRWDG